MNGFDVNDPTQKYQLLRSLPGCFSGLQMVCLMYAAFKAPIQLPTLDSILRMSTHSRTKRGETREIPKIAFVLNQLEME